MNIVIDEQLELRSVQVEFAPWYVGLVKSNYDYLCQWLVWPPKMDGAEDFVAFIEHCQQQQQQGTGITLGIFYQQRLVGNVAFKDINHRLKTVEFGYWLAQDYQGKGIVTRACEAMIQYALEQLKLEKVEIHVATENYASQRVCQRLGLTEQAIVRGAEDLHGTLVDHKIYSS